MSSAANIENLLRALCEKPIYLAMGALLFLFYLAIAGPFVFALACYKWWHKRNVVATVFLILAGLLLPFSYLVYGAFYPSDSFYREEFATLAKFSFPASGSIIRKSASYPDIHGDYAACARVEVSQIEYDRLLAHFANNPSYAYDSTNFIGGEEFSWVTNNLDKKEYIKQFATGDVITGAYIFFGFLRDRKTIIMYRVSS